MQIPDSPSHPAAQPLVSASLRTICKSLYEPAPLLGASTTPQELEALSLRCRAHWSRQALRLNSLKNRFFASLVLGALYLLVAGTGIGADTPLANQVGQFLVLELMATIAAMLALSGLSMLVVDVLGLDSANCLEAQLVPLRETSFGCRQANSHVELSASARAYRDTVLRTGRDLRMFDLELLRLLTQEDYRKAYHARNDQECRVLHGIEAPSP